MPWLLAALVVLLLAPASASAANLTGADALAIADAYWGPHPCAGRVTATIDPTLPDRGLKGESPGMVFTPGEWHRVSCAITLAPNLTPAVACAMVVHEVGHLIYGPGHAGPMASVDPPQCRLAPLLTPRRRLIANVRKDLPEPQAAWRISCTPDGLRMRCRATNPRARYVRVSIGAWVTPTDFGYSGTRIAHPRGIAR